MTRIFHTLYTKIRILVWSITLWSIQGKMFLRMYVIYCRYTLLYLVYIYMSYTPGIHSVYIPYTSLFCLIIPSPEHLTQIYIPSAYITVSHTSISIIQLQTQLQDGSRLTFSWPFSYISFFILYLTRCTLPGFPLYLLRLPCHLV